ncbi:ATP-dependent RNA helicase DeaD [Ereboglobus sp. PH5-10]|uniref:DEAD/DEAH box helicase n=1 Tax=Ereboglobus sp. PH5-10 TaxID=2940629 RepID=UPI002405611B|nr:DEAD/DEAH box helicase [Ereboglobus sp. PH5-10]MDF9826385.1 ATP-dependent RNA helicase DeaD [Ereboglobus sp. PH5-10]
MSNLRFSELGLSAEILKAVDKMGFEEASPIQTAAIPPIMAGEDIVGLSSTGSGKTAAFAIPMVEKIDPKMRKVQVLVLCPTRELAVQVAEEVAKISLFKRGVQAVPIFGGQSYDRQFRALESGVQIVIGTPGRVIDHIERGTLRLDALKMLVLDEADRMLDMGFREDIERVLMQVPTEHQTLFFSATMPRQIEELIRKYSRNPKRIKIEAVAQNAPQVDQVYFEVERRSKIEVLTRIIDINDFRYGIVFCSTKLMVDELDEHLHARGYATERLHGDISQAQRTRVMDKFRRRGFEFLIATDVAARGLDVDDLEVVFNFDLPNDAEDYTHRIGRTGRAGKSGRAFTFVSGRELYSLQNMIRYGKLKIRREKIPSLDLVEEARENQFFEKLRTTLDAAEYRKQDRLIDRLLEQGYASTDIIAALIHVMHGGEGDKKSQPSPAEWVEPAGRKDGKKHEKFSSKPPKPAKQKQKYDRPARTGREAGFATLFFSAGRKQLVTPADIVGKIAGVTRLPAEVVGAIDIHQRHTLVDVRKDAAELIIEKVNGIRMRGDAVRVTMAEPGQMG